MLSVQDGDEIEIDLVNKEPIFIVLVATPKKVLLNTKSILTIIVAYFV